MPMDIQKIRFSDRPRRGFARRALQRSGEIAFAATRHPVREPAVITALRPLPE
jgi:hypothetical protein